MIAVQRNMRLERMWRMEGGPTRWMFHYLCKSKMHNFLCIPCHPPIYSNFIRLDWRYKLVPRKLRLSTGLFSSSGRLQFALIPPADPTRRAPRSALVLLDVHLPPPPLGRRPPSAPTSPHHLLAPTAREWRPLGNPQRLPHQRHQLLRHQSETVLGLPGEILLFMFYYFYYWIKSLCKCRHGENRGVDLCIVHKSLSLCGASVKS